MYCHICKSNKPRWLIDSYMDYAADYKIHILNL